MAVRFHILILSIILIFCATTSVACPICHTDIGQQVRAEIFGPDFIKNLLITAMPFPVLATLVAFISYSASWSSHREDNKYDSS